MSDYDDNRGRTIAAYVLLGLAAYLILAEIGLLDFFGVGDLVSWVFSTIWRLMPAAITVLGLYWITQSESGSKPLAAWFLTGLGLVLLVSQFGWFDLSFGELFIPFWLLIVAFVIMNPRDILPRRFNTRKNEVGDDTENIQLVAFMGGGELNYSSKKLHGGEVVAIWGGYEIDFREADMEEEQMELTLICVMGGVEISVPSHWEVEKRGAICIMGGFSNKTRCMAEELEMPRKKLIIKGLALMGGGEIKN